METAGGPPSAAAVCRVLEPRLRLVATALVILSALAAALPASAAGEGERLAGVQLRLPASFSPAPTAVARERVAPLAALAAVSGLQAIGPVDLRYDVLGPPAQPQAAFVAARFLTPVGARSGDVFDARCVGLLLAELSRQEPELVFEEPEHRVVAGAASLLLKGREALPGGRIGLHYGLLAQSEQGLFLMRLTAVDVESRGWDATWNALLGSLVLGKPERSDGTSPLVWVALGLAGLGCGEVARRLLRGKRSSQLDDRPSVAPGPRLRTAPVGLALFDAADAALHGRAPAAPAPPSAATQARPGPRPARSGRPAPAAPAAHGSAPRGDEVRHAGDDVPEEEGGTSFERALARRLAGESGTRPPAPGPLAPRGSPRA